MPVMEKYVTVEEVSQELRVSTVTVQRYIKRGELPALKVGGVYRILASDYEAFKTARSVHKSEQDS